MDGGEGSPEAPGLSDRAQGFLSLTRAQAPTELSDDVAVALARRLDEAVATHAKVPDWSERDDVRRDIRGEAMRVLLADETTRPLVTPAFLDELMTVATAEILQALSTEKSRFAALFAEPSGGLEPPTPSLPSTEGSIPAIGSARSR